MTSSHASSSSCTECAHPIEPTAKFCGECGATTHSSVYHSVNDQIPATSAFAQAAQRLARVESIRSRTMPAPQLAATLKEVAQNARAQSDNNQTGVKTTPQMPGRTALSSSGRMSMPMSEAYIPYETPAENARPRFNQTINQEPLPANVRAPSSVTYDDLAKLESYRLAHLNHRQTNWQPTPSPGTQQISAHPSGITPSFAGTKSGAVPAHLISEMQTINTHILRERLFLLMHTAIFLTANLVGFFLSMKCYYGYNGDEVARMVIALTPLTFINAVALACLAPIKGTRREIARLLEKKQFLRIQIEYSNVKF